MKMFTTKYFVVNENMCDVAIYWTVSF